MFASSLSKCPNFASVSTILYHSSHGKTVFFSLDQIIRLDFSNSADCILNLNSVITSGNFSISPCSKSEDTEL